MTKPRHIKNPMIRNLFDTFSALGFLVGLTFGLVVLSKFPIPGFLLFVFAVVFSIVALVNASPDD